MQSVESVPAAEPVRTPASARPVPASPEAWRGFAPGTRRTILDAARDGRPATDVAHATAAVSYGRHVRRTGHLSGGVLAAAMVAFLGYGLLVAHGIAPLPHQSVDETIRDLLLAAFVAGGTGVVALLYASVGVHRLIGTNLPLATVRPDGPAPASVRIGMRAPRLLEVVEVALVIAAFVAMPLLHNYLTTAAMVVALVAYARVGPAGIEPYAATVDANGIYRPRWRARVPWTSVRSVALGDDHRVRVGMDGPFEVTGVLPAVWAARVATELAPGATFSIGARTPELAVWTAQRYLDAVRTTGSATPAGGHVLVCA